MSFLRQNNKLMKICETLMKEKHCESQFNLTKDKIQQKKMLES